MVTAGGAVGPRDAWEEFMEKTLLDVFNLGLKKNNAWRKIFTEKKSNKRREEIVQFQGADVVVITPEDAPYAELRMEKTRTKAAIHDDYTGMIRVTYAMKRDKQYDQIEKDSWSLGEAYERQLYEEACSMWFGGFESVTGPDEDVPLFSASHTCLLQPGTTWSNIYVGALDVDGFDAAHVSMSYQRNENGKITPTGQDGTLQLIHPPKLRRLSKQLAMKGEYEPGKNNFDINTFDIDPVCIPMLNNAPATWRDKQWYLRDPDFAENLFLNREGPIYDSYTDKATDAMIIKVRGAHAFMHGASWGIVGSQGA
jgi:hypothetical protein